MYILQLIIRLYNLATVVLGLPGVELADLVFPIPLTVALVASVFVALLLGIRGH